MKAVNRHFRGFMKEAMGKKPTASFTAQGWEGSFYPKGMRSPDYLAFYAEHFHTVEVDSTFYACPSARTVGNWNARTPEGFIFSVKVPQTITPRKGVVRLRCRFARILHGDGSSRAETGTDGKQ
jgi:uncharacterized protein YecE (DUF72 family)